MGKGIEHGSGQDFVIGGARLRLILSAGSARAATQIVNISAANGDGTIVALDAGTYTISFIGTDLGGAYPGYSPWTNNSGCDASGMNCSTGFIANLAIDYGVGGVFTRVNGYQHGLRAEPGNNHIFDTGAQAIADINAGDIIRAPLPQLSDPNAYISIGGPITVTLAASQTVNFFIVDSPYSDNRGGISILLDDGIAAVPEPASWAMMIAGMAMVGAGLRRRTRRTVRFA